MNGRTESEPSAPAIYRDPLARPMAVSSTSFVGVVAFGAFFLWSLRADSPYYRLFEWLGGVLLLASAAALLVGLIWLGAMPAYQSSQHLD